MHDSFDRHSGGAAALLANAMGLSEKPVLPMGKAQVREARTVEAGNERRPDCIAAAVAPSTVVPREGEHRGDFGESQGDCRWKRRC